MSGSGAHSVFWDSQAQRTEGFGGFAYQLFIPKGGTLDRWFGWDYAQHLRDDHTEFPEMDLDMARTKAWTVDVDAATNDWYKCRRSKGVNTHTGCLEVGEALRRAHWKHQLQIKESGCEEALFRFAKCLEFHDRQFVKCRRFELPFVACIQKAGNMNLMATTPLELRRPELMRNEWWKAFGQYRAWIKRRDGFMQRHPDWFEEDDVEIMSPKQLFKYISKKQPWLDRGDVKPFSTYSFPTRFREYVPKKNQYIAQGDFPFAE
mmetsp:Transcript_22605/g.36264  ORF Transcript_22605/g.36264 Transcript_22605/m.36264 type:complete len:262 (-) Transcript_22605:142-927(-)|eukprot:CAMPEP_0202713794 /NCGR_PEP_ID=MMETSP1385-20130828/59606_1 /ASSEMBLY_ACC=CAM_ASM_000861 /TAXON_ID=933848 /ORGANISM="Elphidium margaritaceum" /LENGTH=261 /DNA_ID=CAMNT_0049374275 /DNA_START=60 /DNA_END=845 /DNA_ORIENTATION=+